MVKPGTLKQLKTLLAKGPSGLKKYYNWKNKYAPKLARMAQKGLNVVNKHILKNDKSLIKSILRDVLPGGNYIDIGMNIASKIIDTNGLEDLADIAEKAQNGEYKSGSEVISEMLKVLDKGKVIGKDAYKQIKEEKKAKNEKKQAQTNVQEIDFTEDTSDEGIVYATEESEIQEEIPTKTFEKEPAKFLKPQSETKPSNVAGTGLDGLANLI